MPVAFSSFFASTGDGLFFPANIADTIGWVIPTSLAISF